MADQNIAALPATTAPASTDQLLLIGAAEEKLIDYDKLADAILTKLTSKTFALAQGTKTLLAAINELNSKPLTVTINNTSLEAYLANLGEDRYAMLYVLKNNDNPVIDGFRWEYFSIIVIKSRIIAFSPSGKPGVIATRQYINNKLGDWISIK